MGKKRTARKEVKPDSVYVDQKWKVVSGSLKAPRGRKAHTLFKSFGEKIPFESLSKVENEVKSQLGKYRKSVVKGVYVAQDSMTYPRYIGRGDIFGRLKARHEKQRDELRYFSFYVVQSDYHEREIESLLIHIVGPLLTFNQRKKREDIEAPKVTDFEAGTHFIERQKRRGKKKTNRRSKLSTDRLSREK